MRKIVFKKILASMLSMTLIAGMIVIPEKTSTASVDTSGWKTSIALDFGIHPDSEEADTNVNESSLMPKVFADYPDLFTSTPDSPAEAPAAGYGNMTYADTTVSDVYKDSAPQQNSQHIGFDRVMPSAVTTEGGNYFKDWVFSPDGEKYSFSVDLPVGQYYVYVYTGNKTKERNNTTIVNFNNETIGEAALNYDQTSNGASQFYGATRTEVIYVVDVKDNGQGYGTLTAYLSDNTIGNEAYAASHTYTIGDALDENDTKGIDRFDFYEGTDDAINPAADAIVTARLNGIEIAPVASPVHAQDISSTENNIELEINSEASFKQRVAGIEGCTDRIAYLSSNPDVASIDIYSGMITTHKIGEADIYAYNAYLNKYAVTKLSVTAETVISLDKSELSLTLDADDSASAELTASFNMASSEIVEWTSSNPDVTISEASFTQGETSTSKVTVTAKNSGTATITAKRIDTGKTAACTINISRPVKEVSIADKDGNVYNDDAKITITAGDSIDISAIVTPDNATNKTVRFASSDQSVASVSTDNNIGTISGKNAGETVITVTAEDNSEASDTITVTVLPAPVDNNDNTTTVNPSPVPQDSGNTINPSPAPLDNSAVSSSVTLSGKKQSTVKVKKSITFKAKASNTSVKKIKVKIKSGKKLIKVKKSAKKVKVTALKKGKAAIVVTVKAKDGISKKFTRKITIK